MKITNMLSFDIEKFETAVAQKDHHSSMLMLKELLTFCDLFRDIEGKVIEGIDPQDRTLVRGLHPIIDSMPLVQKQLFIQRLASAISSLFGDSQLTLSNDNVLLILFCKDFLRCLFGSTSYKNMDHILRIRGVMNSDRTLCLKTEDDITWLLVCFTLESDINLDFKLMFETFPEYSLYCYVGCLYGNRVNLTEHSTKWIDHFVDVSDYLPEVNFNPVLLDILSSPWMLCSYIEQSDGHKIKKAFNKLVSGWLAKNVPASIQSKFAQNTQQKRKIKKIAVFSEKYQSTHAMYRCYHNYIVSLKDDYELTLVTANGEYDDVSRQDFSRVIDFKYESSYRDLMPMLELLAKESFDMIYYPSIGMSTWAVITSNMRMASHQVMSAGHPASSFSDDMDYLMTMGLDIPEALKQPNIINEKTIDITNDEPGRHFPHPDLLAFRDSIQSTLKKTEDGIVRIAVSSSLMKVTKGFLNMCVEIEKSSKYPLEFHFFPGVKTSFQFQYFQVVLNSYLQRCVIHPPTDYCSYLKLLNQCDVALGTFPFGGANSNTDLLVLGIPKIIKTDITSLSGYTDSISSSMVNGVGIIETDNDEQFLDEALNLIQDVEARNELSEKMRQISLESYLNVDGSYSSFSYMREAVEYLNSNSVKTAVSNTENETANVMS